MKPRHIGSFVLIVALIGCSDPVGPAEATRDHQWSQVASSVGPEAANQANSVIRRILADSTRMLRVAARHGVTAREEAKLERLRRMVDGALFGGSQTSSRAPSLMGCPGISGTYLFVDNMWDIAMYTAVCGGTADMEHEIDVHIDDEYVGTLYSERFGAVSWLEELEYGPGICPPEAEGYFLALHTANDTGNEWYDWAIDQDWAICDVGDPE